MEDNLPSLFIDSKMVQQLRKDVQKPWSREEFWSFYFSRRISIYLSLFLMKKSAISPNLVTIVAILTALAASALFMAATPSSFLLACLFYQFSYVLDCVDGELARMRGQSSRGGDWLDIGLNYAHYFSVFGVVYGVFKDAEAVAISVSIFLILLTIFAEILASNGSSLVFKESTVTKDTVTIRKVNKWLDCFVFLFLTQTGFQLGILIFSICWMLSSSKQLLIAWVGFHLVIGLLRACYKLKLNIKYLS